MSLLREFKRSIITFSHADYSATGLIYTNLILLTLLGQLISVSGLEVILVDGGVDVALAGEEVESSVHVSSGHDPLGLVEHGVPVTARLLRGLFDDSVHEVVVLVAE